MFRLVTDVLTRLRAILDGRERHIRDLERRVDELKKASREQRARWREQRARWRALSTDWSAQRTRWRQRHATWRRVREHLQQRSATFHRQILSPAVVRQLLPLRARTLRARAAHADAARYDARLQEISVAYREALAAVDQPRDDLATTRLEGLTWWVPVPASLSREARDRFVAKQRFPYRNIAQTREFSVGPILIDIGANNGRMSIPRVILGDVERAYCAEPDPLNFAALVRNVACNSLRGLVLPDQVAIGATTGTVRLRHAKYPGGHRLVTDEQPDEHATEVPCWTLDEWCRRLAIDPELVTYVKVDTQGWEVHTLRGAAGLLEHRHIAWQIEIAPALLKAAGTSTSVLFDMCAERFSHFIHLGKTAEGPRARRTRDLPHIFAYMLDEGDPTDIIVFNA